MLNEVLKSCKKMRSAPANADLKTKQEIKELVSKCILHVSGMYIF